MQYLSVVSSQFHLCSCINDVTLMSTRHSNTVTLRSCAAILYNLANDDDNCTSMLDAGALMHVVHLTKADLLATKIKCAAILSRLSLHAKHYDQFARHGVLRVLLNLCNVDNILTQRKLVIAISNLSQVRTILFSLCCTILQLVSFKLYAIFLRIPCTVRRYLFSHQ